MKKKEWRRFKFGFKCICSVCHLFSVCACVEHWCSKEHTMQIQMSAGAKTFNTLHSDLLLRFSPTAHKILVTQLATTTFCLQNQCDELQMNVLDVSLTPTGTVWSHLRQLSSLMETLHLNDHALGNIHFLLLAREGSCNLLLAVLHSKSDAPLTEVAKEELGAVLRSGKDCAGTGHTWSSGGANHLSAPSWSLGGTNHWSASTHNNMQQQQHTTLACRLTS